MFIWHEIKQRKTVHAKKHLQSRLGVWGSLRERLKAALGWGKGDGMKSSVGRLAYSAGWPAELSGHSVLRGTGHCGRNLVHGVRRPCVASGFCAHAAGEGAWERDGGRDCGQEEKDNNRWDRVRHGSGVHQVVWLPFYPSMLCHAFGCYHKQDHLVCSPTFTKTYNSNRQSAEIWVCFTH